MNNNMNRLYYCPVNNVWLNSARMSNQPMNPYFMCPCMYSYNNVPMNRSNPREEPEEYVEEYDYDDNFNEDEWEAPENEIDNQASMPSYERMNSSRNGTEGHPEYNLDDNKNKSSDKNCFMKGINIERVNIKEILD